MKALASVTGLTQPSAWWNQRHAVAAQLVRASESLVLHLAEGARLGHPANQQHWLDLGHSQAELEAGPLTRGVGRLARVALLIRGLASV